MAQAPRRVADHLEQGLALLTVLGAQPELGEEKIERCRLLADEDGRLRFIYNLPASAGFGAAIGRTVERALFGKTRRSASVITALLNVFMTLLDGLLDEAYELIAPELAALRALVRSGGRRRDAIFARPGRHPLAALCSSTAELWLRKVDELGRLWQAGCDGQFSARHGANEPWACAAAGDGRRASAAFAFKEAALKALAAEFASRRARFDETVAPGAAVLFGRTRWPHYCQALACVIAHRAPSTTAAGLAALRRFMFATADYAALLDDVCDYLEDCEALRWNTVSCALQRQKRLPVVEPAAVQTALVLRLTEKETEKFVIAKGLRLLDAIERAAAGLGVNPTEVFPLVADLTYVYLGESTRARTAF